MTDISSTVDKFLCHYRTKSKLRSEYMQRTDNARGVRLALVGRSGLARQERRGRDLGYADRARVRREDRVRPELLCECAEELLLEREVL